LNGVTVADSGKNCSTNQLQFVGGPSIIRLLDLLRVKLCTNFSVQYFFFIKLSKYDYNFSSK